jgi:hypothetical protein
MGVRRPGRLRTALDGGVRQKVRARVGATVIGRRTFDLGVRPWGGTPWPGIPASWSPTGRGRTCWVTTAGGLRSTFDGEQAELIPEGKPVTGTVTHLGFRVVTA